MRFRLLVLLLGLVVGAGCGPTFKVQLEEDHDLVQGSPVFLNQENIGKLNGFETKGTNPVAIVRINASGEVRDRLRTGVVHLPTAERIQLDDSGVQPGSRRLTSSDTVPIRNWYDVIGWSFILSLTFKIAFPLIVTLLERFVFPFIGPRVFRLWTIVFIGGMSMGLGFLIHPIAISSVELSYDAMGLQSGVKGLTKADFPEPWISAWFLATLVCYPMVRVAIVRALNRVARNRLGNNRVLLVFYRRIE